MRKTTRRPLIISVICVCALVLILASLSVFSALASDSKYVAEVNSVKYENYADAWNAVSNVTLADDVGEAKGFNDAANQVEEGINEFLQMHDIDANKAKFRICIMDGRQVR